jgi:hypothetical protein
MPKIPQYEQQIRVNRGIEGRRASADDFDVGRGVSRLGEAVGDVAGATHREAERKDLSTLHAELATVRADAEEDLQRRVQSGEINAEDALDQYNNAVSERVSQIQNKMTTRGGQASAAARGAETTEGLRKKAFGVKAAADGALVVDNFKVAHNKNGDAIYRDPSQLQPLVAETTAFINDPNGPYALLPADKRRELLQTSRDELGILAARGMIDNVSPELFKKQLKAGQWDGLIPADKVPGLDSMADEAIRAQRSDEDRAYTLAKRAKADADDKIRDSFIQRMEKPDLGGLTFTEIAKSKLSDPDLKLRMRAVLEQRIKNPDVTSNPQVYLDVQRKIYLPPDHPDKIDDPRVVMNLFSVNKQLGHKDLQDLMLDMERAKTQDALGRDLQTLSGQVHSTFMRSPMGQATGADLIAMGDTAMYNWRKWVDSEVARVREEGGNPRDLLDPESKDYVASPGRLSTFLGTAKSTVIDQANAAKTAAEGTIQQFKQGWGVYRGGKWQPITAEEAAKLRKVDTLPVAAEKGAEQSLETAFGFIEALPKSISVVIDAPPKSSIARLNGKKFASREEAQQAIRDVLK